MLSTHFNLAKVMFILIAYTNANLLFIKSVTFFKVFLKIDQPINALRVCFTKCSLLETRDNCNDDDDV